MKALDTSVLLRLLEGDPPVRQLLRRLRGEEIATTEANMLELGVLAGAAPAKMRGDRRTALARLRRRITVLPLDSKGANEASARAEGGARNMPTHVLGMLGALEAHGCDELYTAEPGQILGKWRFKVRRV